MNVEDESEESRPPNTRLQRPPLRGAAEPQRSPIEKG